jgi:hypothetical protein
MSDINQIKKEEMDEIISFYYFIEEYGHIFYDDPNILNEPFKKILEGIDEVKKIIDDNFSR